MKKPEHLCFQVDPDQIWDTVKTCWFDESEFIWTLLLFKGNDLALMISHSTSVAGVWVFKDQCHSD